jgi:hypothetical protein
MIVITVDSEDSFEITSDDDFDDRTMLDLIIIFLLRLRFLFLRASFLKRFFSKDIFSCCRIMIVVCDDENDKAFDKIDVKKMKCKIERCF